MNEQGKREVARMFRRWADQIEEDEIAWLHITLCFKNQGRVTFATKGAPKRPAGLG